MLYEILSCRVVSLDTVKGAIFRRRDAGRIHVGWCACIFCCWPPRRGLGGGFRVSNHCFSQYRSKPAHLVLRFTRLANASLNCTQSSLRVFPSFSNCILNRSRKYSTLISQSPVTCSLFFLSQISRSCASASKESEVRKVSSKLGGT